MTEPVTITTLLAAVGSLVVLICDKMRYSRCKHIVCCCCFECDREVINVAEAERAETV